MLLRQVTASRATSRNGRILTPATALRSSGKDRATLVSGDRFQPLHQLHGVHRFLLVRRLRSRSAETILVEQPDNCRKGCPACSRVCPENAIIFPQHKTPAIAGLQWKRRRR